MVVIDSDMLLLALDPAAAAPSVPYARERMEGLLKELSDSGVRVLVPAPVLAEVLVKAGKATPQYLEILSKNRALRVAPFDEKSAVEFAQLFAGELPVRRGARRQAGLRDRIKFDQQIVAIARAEGAGTLYTEDANLRGSAERAGLEVKGLKDLPIPTEARQTGLPLDQ